jgi:hypothetical protein
VDNFASRHPRQETQSTAIDLPPEAETHAHGKEPTKAKRRETKGNEFAIAHNPFRKKQDQEQKRFLRQSHGEDSRKPIAIRTNQAIKEQD